ncbi:unnamed protein product [Prunus armeniaca]
MGHGNLRPRGDLTTVSSAVSFTAFGFGLQYCGSEAERILPLQLFFCFQEGEMPIEAVGARTERKSLQSKAEKHGKHPVFNRYHSCQLITNEILVKNITEVIKKWKEDELQREKFELQRQRRPYGGPKMKCTATREGLR